MEDWHDRACLERYLALPTARLRLSENSQSGAYQVLRDEFDIEQARNAASRERREKRWPIDDLRVGLLADDPYLLVLREAVRFPDGNLGLYNRLSVYPASL